jgi:hypothetical protein
MRKSLLSVVAATMLVAATGFASAQSETPTAPFWNANQGPVFHSYTTTRHYSSYADPGMTPTIGMVVPGTVTVYEMPDSMNGPQYSNYRYGMINDHPVVIESSTRRIVHTWE